MKFFRRDANDRVLNAVEILGFTDDVRIAFVTILPGEVANDRDRMGIASFAFFRSKSAAEHWANTERVEIICRNDSTRSALRPVADA